MCHNILLGIINQFCLYKREYKSFILQQNYIFSLAFWTIFHHSKRYKQFQTTPPTRYDVIKFIDQFDFD